MFYRSFLLTLILAGIALSYSSSSVVARQPDSHAEPEHQAVNNSNTDIDPAHLKRLEELRKSTAAEGYKIAALYADKRFEVYDDIDDFFTKSAERKSVDLKTYKKILGFEAKKRQGRGFIAKHIIHLKSAEAEYGISKFVIAAILGIESDYGKNVGRHNPFNAYVSMYVVDYRADFAKAQLLELMEFAQRNNVDVLDLKSSYAGAVSFAQFIPYSLNKWFVGKDIASMENNIRSVANYLAYFEKRTKSIRTTILRYNPSGMYADAVLELADELEKSYGDS